MAAQRTILVTASTGHVGSELVPMLGKEQNTKLVLPTRSAAKLRSTLASVSGNNIIVEEGDITNPSWYTSLLVSHSVDTVFLCIPGGAGSELDITLNALDCMRRAGTVKQCVYVGICGDYVSPEGIKQLTANCAAGHMLVKIPIELALKHGGYPFATTILGPTLFFGNDERSKRAMLERGVFDEPIERASRVSESDIALAARNVMFASPADKYYGRKIQIGSRKLFSSAEIAELWSKALGKKVKPWGTDMDLFEREHVSVWGPGFARDVRLMYEGIEALGLGMSEEEYATQVEVLGREAGDYEEWVETGNRWLVERA